MRIRKYKSVADVEEELEIVRAMFSNQGPHQTYIQKGDLSDPFAQSERVKIRRATSRNLIKTLSDSQELFD
jgi:hypothetical protein